MPDFQAFHAKVKVDGIELPEYDVQIDLDRKCVSCWVPSEAGKAFSVCWSNAQPRTDTIVVVTLDGIYSGSSSSRKGDKRERIRSDCRVSPTTARNFNFSPIALTDDDAYLDAPTTNLGEIKIEFYTMTITNIIRSKTPKKWVDPAATSNMKVHERSKKAGAHRIQFGDPRKISRKKNSRTTSKKGEKLATFVFRYRPLEMLQANGIAPPAAETANVQRDSSNKPIDILEIESSDEDEIDRHVNELKDKLERLETRRRAKKQKVKQEEHLPRLNEVIDLT